jgi:hypothetical protein
LQTGSGSRQFRYSLSLRQLTSISALEPFLIRRIVSSSM